MLSDRELIKFNVTILAGLMILLALSLNNDPYISMFKLDSENNRINSKINELLDSRNTTTSWPENIPENITKKLEERRIEKTWNEISSLIDERDTNKMKIQDASDTALAHKKFNQYPSLSNFIFISILSFTISVMAAIFSNMAVDEKRKKIKDYSLNISNFSFLFGFLMIAVFSIMLLFGL